jgi:hypothetical protein
LQHKGIDHPDHLKTFVTDDSPGAFGDPTVQDAGASGIARIGMRDLRRNYLFVQIKS